MSDRNNYEYGNDDYDGAEDGGGKNNGTADENTDQYFDDAGDIGYLPADHVSPFNFHEDTVAKEATWGITSVKEEGSVDLAS